MNLASYNFTIMYKSGSTKTNADALSRIKFNSDNLRQMMISQSETNVSLITRSMRETFVSDSSYQ